MRHTQSKWIAELLRGVWHEGKQGVVIHEPRALWSAAGECEVQHGFRYFDGMGQKRRGRALVLGCPIEIAVDRNAKLPVPTMASSASGPSRAAIPTDAEQ